MQADEKIAQLENKISNLEMASKANLEASSMLFSSRFGQTDSEDEIDLAALFKTIWEGKFKIISVAFLFAVSSVFYALSLPNIYTSTLKLVPTAQEDEGGLSSLASKYGGLASMAGINLGGGGAGNSIEHAVELMNSWPYIEAFVEKHDLKVTLMATNGWDAKTNTLLFDNANYDAENQKWLLKETWFSSELESQEPTSFETYEEINKEIINVSFDDELGIFNISVNHYSPVVAYELTELLKNDINEYFRAQDKKEAQSSIQFIENKIENTANSQLREVFYSMIESHTQKIMMTEINEEYLVKTLIPAKIAEPKQKSKPKRGLIVLVATFLGSLLGLFWVLITSFRQSKAVKDL